MRAHLTDVVVRGLRPVPGKQTKVWDTSTAGFGVLVGERSKSWFVMFGRKRALKVIGRYPAVSLSDARSAARKIIAAPPPEEVAPPKPFLEVRDEFFERHGAHIRASSLRQLRLTIVRHFQWRKPITQITHLDVVKVLEGIKAPSERAHAQKDITTFFNWCIPRYLAASPCAGLRKEPQPSRDRLLSEDELRKVWFNARDIGYPYGTIVQLLILLGQRTGETAAIRWTWIKNDVLTIPGRATKNGRDSVIPLNGMALEVIATVPRFCDLLFPMRGDTERPFRGFGSGKCGLDKCGVKNFTHHDLRRTASSMWAQIGVPQHINDRLLNHVSGGALSTVARIYNRYEYLPEKRAALEQWEAKLTTIFGEEP